VIGAPLGRDQSAGKTVRWATAPFFFSRPGPPRFCDGVTLPLVQQNMSAALRSLRKHDGDQKNPTPNTFRSTSPEGRRVWRSNFFHNSAFIRLGRNEIPIFEFCAASRAGENIVIGKHYFTRQATTLLMLAKSTTDANVAAALIDKAADLKSRLDESGVPDPTSLAPDIEPPT